MADGGIATGALLGAVLSSSQNKDPLQGALMGGLGSLAFGAFADPFTGETITGLPTVAEDVGVSTQALTGLQEPLITPSVDAFTTQQAATATTPLSNATLGNASAIAGNPQLGGVASPVSNLAGTNLQDYGPVSPYAAGSTNGIVGAQGPLNVTGGLSSLGTTAASNAPFLGTETPDLVSGAYGASTPTTSALSGVGSFLDKNKYLLGGGLGLAYLMQQDRNKYGIPPTEKYSGPLSKFSYDPLTYRPDVVTPPSPLYRAQYAGGGPIEQMSNQNAIGANTGFPQANLHNPAYATPYQMPISQNVLSGPSDTRVDPFTGEERMAKGGIAHYDLGGEIMGGLRSGINSAVGGFNNLLTNASQGRVSTAPTDTMSWDDPRFQADMEAMLNGKRPPSQAKYAAGGISSLGSYSDGGRLLPGPGDGVSDSIPAQIGQRQPARLADGEFVVPARIVSELGNGSTEAGARQLYKMMDRVQQARGKTTGKDRVAKNTNAAKYLPA